MKRSATVALAALVLASGVAHAIPFFYENPANPLYGQAYVGPVELKVSNWETSTSYATPPVGGVGYSGLPMLVPAPGDPIDVGGVQALDLIGIGAPASAYPTGRYPGLNGGLEDVWGVAKVTQIQTPLGEVVWSPAVKGQELTIFFHGAQDIHLETYGPDPAKTRIGAIGLVLEIWSEPLPSATAFPEPVTAPGARTGPTAYPGVTDGTLELRMVSLPGFINPPGTGAGLATEFESRFNFTALLGDAEAYMELLPGTNSYDQFNTDPHLMDPANAAVLGPMGFDTAADLALQINSYPGVPGWSVTSTDPLRATVIPEPLTAWLLSVGGLALWRRRARRRG